MIVTLLLLGLSPFLNPLPQVPFLSAPAVVHATTLFVSNSFITDPSITTPKIASTTIWYDYRFTALHTGTVTKVSTYISSVTGSPGLTLALYADNGLSSHLPSGSPLGSATAKPVANAYAWKSAGVGNRLTLSPSVAITAGTVYHLVVSSINASSSNYFYIQYYPQNKVWINGTSNPNRAVLASTNSGSTWSTLSPRMEPVYSLLFSNNLVEGNGYVSGPTDLDHIYGTVGGVSVKQGFTFYISALESPVTFNKISMVIAKTGTPADNLYGHIASVTTAGPYHNGETLATGKIWLDFTFATPTETLPTCCTYGGTLSKIPAWTNATFSPVSLNAGEYVFYLDSPLSKSTAYYDLLQSDGRGADLSSSGTYLDGRLTYGFDQQSTFVASSHTGTALNTEFGVDIPFFLSQATTTVTQPIELGVNEGGAPPQTFTISGCSPSPSTIVGDGAVHSITVNPSCAFTLVGSTSSGTRWGFISSGTFSSSSTSQTSCASAACTQINLAYDHQFQLVVNGGNGLTYSLTSETSDGWYKYGDSLVVSSNGVWGRSSGTGTRLSSWNFDGSSNTNIAQTTAFTTSSITMTATHTVNFNSVTQYQITVTAGTGGTASATTSPTISGDTGWYDVSTVVTFTAISDLGSVFSGWTGTGAGSYSGTNNPATATIVADTTETAGWTALYYVQYAQNGCVLSFSLPASEWVNPGNAATESFPSLVSGSRTQCLFVRDNRPPTITGSTTITALYQTQYLLTVNSTYGSPTGQGWYDAGANASSSVTSPVGGGSGTQYVMTGFSGTGDAPSSGNGSSVSFALNRPSSVTWNWKIQYDLQFAQSGLDSTAQGTIVSVTIGANSPVTLAFGDFTKDFGYIDSGTTIAYTFTSPISSSSASEQLVLTTPAPKPSSGFSLSGPTTVTGTFKAQYEVQFAVSPSGAGTTVPSSSTWYDARSTGIPISASAILGYTFSSWSSTCVFGSSCLVISNSTAASTNVTVNGPGTLTASFLAGTISMSCTSPAAVGLLDTCTLIVSNVNATYFTAPAGTVLFSGAPAGFPSSESLSSVDCISTATSVSCAFSFTPSAGSEGTYSSMTATYGGDTTHQASSGTTSLTVQTTTTAIIACPTPAIVGVSESCVVTVTNADLDYATAATEMVTFSGAPLGFPSSCTLAGGSCVFSWTPLSGSQSNFTITATYGGDTMHRGSFSTESLVLLTPPALTAPMVSVPASAIDTGQSATLWTTTSFSGGAPRYICQWLEQAPGGSFTILGSPFSCNTGDSPSTSTGVLSATGAWSFELQVTDSWYTSATSNTAVVTVNSQLTAQTVSASLGTVYQGQSSSLTSTTVTTGTLPYAYQWLEEAPGGSSYSPITGATSSSYVFATSPSTAAGAWSFELQVTDNTGASVTSNAAVVTTIQALLTQPLTVTVLETGAPTGTYAVNGCSPSPPTGLTGTTTSFTMASPCSFTISFTNSGSVRWGFISGGAFSATSGTLGPTCSSGTCSTISVDADYQVLLTVNGGNGVTYSVPSETSDGWYKYGDSLTVSSNGVWGRLSGTGTRLASWNLDGGPSTSIAQTTTFTTTTVTTTAAHTVDFNSVTQYQITFVSSPSGGGTSTATTSPTISGDTGWYNVNTVVSFTATPNSGYTFSAWTGTGAGSYSGTNNPASVTLTAYVVEAAAFATKAATVALDGSSSNHCSSSTLTSCTVTLTTSKGNDVVMLYVLRVTGSASYTISDTAGLTWNVRRVSGSQAALTVYYAIATSALSSDTIKASLSSSSETLQMMAFGVSGANTASPFDPGVSSECMNHGAVPAGGTVSCSITTTHANDMVIGFGEEVQAGGLRAGSGYTQITSATVSGIGAVEYSIVTSSGSQTISWTNSASSGQTIGVTGDAITAA